MNRRMNSKIDMNISETLLHKQVSQDDGIYKDYIKTIKMKPKLIYYI